MKTQINFFSGIKPAALALGIFLHGFVARTENIAASSSSAKPPVPATCQIRNRKYGDLLRPENANSANGTRLVLYSAEPWKCMTWHVQPIGNATFTVKNLFTSKTFAAEANTNQAQPAVVQVPLKKDAPDAPVWQFTKLDDGTYKITDATSSKALTAIRNGAGWQTIICTAPWQSLEEQKWELQAVDPKQLTM